MARRSREPDRMMLWCDECFRLALVWPWWGRLR